MTHPALTRALDILRTAETREHITSWVNDRGPVDDIDAAVAEQIGLRAAGVEEAFTRWITDVVPPLYRASDLHALRPEQEPAAIHDWLRSKSRTLILVGKPGTGKTHAAYALLIESAARALVMGGVSADCPAASTLAGLLDELRPSAAAPEQLWERVKAAPLLLLDDMARTRPTEWASERVWMLTDYRVTHDLRTIVTTNATGEALAEAWGDGTVDRLRDAATLIRVTGESQRRLW